MVAYSPEEWQVLMTAFKSLSLTGDLVEKVSWWTSGAAGAIAATIVTDLESLLGLFGLEPLKHCFAWLAASCVLGYVAFYCSILRKSQYLTIELIFNECGAVQSFDCERFVRIFFDKLPFY